MRTTASLGYLLVWIILSRLLQAPRAQSDQLALRSPADDTFIPQQLYALSRSDPAEVLQRLPSHLRRLSRLDNQHRRLLWQVRQTTRLTRHAKRQVVDVLVVAPSARASLDRRTRLRQQFPRNMKLAPAGYSAILKFALSASAYNDTQAEDAQFSDVVFFDCIDADDALNWQPNWKVDAGPSSTTCKVMNSVQWAVKYYSFRYFFRLGDDSYFRIDRFLNMLAQNQLPTGKAVIGQILKTWIIGMDQEYAQGMGYGLTPDVCEYIAAAAPWLLDTAPEDGVVARWLFAVGTQFVHNPAWRALDLGEHCDENMVLAHKLPVESWSNITADGMVDC